MIEEIKKRVQDSRQAICDTLCELIAVPTENPPGRAYKTCTDYLSGILDKWGIGHEIITISSGEYPRYAIIGSIGKNSGGLHLHGHYDVVPAVSPEQFKPVIREDRIYGRGSADMKSGLAVILFTLRSVQEMGHELKGHLSFSFVPDEETGSEKGTQYLLNSDLIPEATLGMLMPEPTGEVIWNANKGALTYRVRVEGKPAHVALAHQGINPFEHMVEAARDVLSLKESISARKTELKVSLPGADRSAILVGGVTRSGVNFNTVPEQAEFSIDRRINPEEDHGEARREIERILRIHQQKGRKIDWELLQEGRASFSDPESPLAKALDASSKAVTGKETSVELCPGLLETRLFNARGYSSYAYGPGRLETAHGPEEWVSIPALLNSTAVYALTAMKMLA